MTQEAAGRPLVEVKAYLDDLLRVADWEESSNGLVIGGRPLVSKVGLAVNCSFQAIEGAAQRRCDLLVTHHAAWSSTDAYLAEQKYDRLRQVGLNLYVAHECLDAARDLGTADALARAVKVAIQGSFQPDGEHDWGVHGVTTGHFAEFAARTGNKLGTEPRVWKNSDSFGHVAIVAGYGPPLCQRGQPEPHYGWALCHQGSWRDGPQRPHRHGPQPGGDLHPRGDCGRQGLSWPDRGAGAELRLQIYLETGIILLN
jgi:hypothetical protein